MNTQLPCYTDTDGCTYTYDPVDNLCNIRRFKIAMCARQRMESAHISGAKDGFWFDTWKGERLSFWSTLARSIPNEFQ